MAGTAGGLSRLTSIQSRELGESVSNPAPATTLILAVSGAAFDLAPHKGPPQGPSDDPTALAEPTGRAFGPAREPDYAVLGKRPG